MIAILLYQETWPQEFLRLGLALRRELGNLALRIDHIGSTSVPGLPAKDIIDIQVTVADFRPEVQAAIERAGYQRIPEITNDHLPPGAPENTEDWEKWFFRSAPEQRRVNLHVRKNGLPNQRYPLLFRDYLRAHPFSAETYAQIKTTLAYYHADDVDAYYAVKDPVCDLILDGAEMWARESHWQPGPSDC